MSRQAEAHTGTPASTWNHVEDSARATDTVVSGVRPDARLGISADARRGTMDDEELEHAKRLVGKTLKEKYRLDGVLGIGGMGAVYRGTHRNGNRVAVKTLHTHLSIRADVRTRFLKEGYTANAVDHEGVVRVLDDDITEDGTAFLVMELLSGETLDGRWERCGHRLPPSEVLDSAYQLLDVLASAHAKGIVHRDLKPENLFITKGDVLKVLDFGIARVQHDVNTHQKTRTGTLLGTPAFMPPEQALGRVSQIDGRTDIWATGATMFTLLSGQFVHAAENIEMLRIMAATTPARKLRDVAPAIPQAIGDVVDRALAFELKDRWGGAREMQDAVVAAHRTAFGGAPPSMKVAPSPRKMAAMAATESSESLSPSRSFGTDPTEAGVEPSRVVPPTVNSTQFAQPSASSGPGFTEHIGADAASPAASSSARRDAAPVAALAKAISTTAGVSQSDEAPSPPAKTAPSAVAPTLGKARMIAGAAAILVLITAGGFFARSRLSAPTSIDKEVASGTPLVQRESVAPSAAPPRCSLLQLPARPPRVWRSRLPASRRHRRRG